MDANQFADILSALVSRRDISDEAMHTVMHALMRGEFGDAEAAAILIGLRMKGETAGEIAAAATVLRQHMVRWDPGRPDVLDTCGTGGDGSGTFNISTATALVVAGTGTPVVKHGNRSVSSRSGSADVLLALGVGIEGDADCARRSLDRAGLAFCFAPQFHPAMKHVAQLRRRLRVPTIFNCLGPLANPAGAAYQLLGVGRPELLDLMAGALARLGSRHAFVVCSDDGLDEVSLSAATAVREVRDTTIRAHSWRPEDFGLAPCRLDELRADGCEASAAMVRDVLHGKDSAPGRVVLANAAAALLAAERVSSLRDGVALAREAIRGGKALEVLERLRTS